VAEQLRCNPATVYRHVADGQLPSLRIGGLIRIPAGYLERRTS
jgi:excisionase family DNA binding protein